ncbi:MAG: YraN family protein [Clostridia bacterium]|jgi:putative endonuclease|nr:YraN family protein [Clostridia bacterium]
MKQTYETGLAGEETAERFLEGKGMVCLLRRYRNKCGEIDLVMKDRETIVFVEVKTRKKAGPGQGLLAVDRKKQMRIFRAATLYLMEEKKLNTAVRFDIVEIGTDAVIHVPNAFQPSGTMFFH